jgi:ribosome-associated protein
MDKGPHALIPLIVQAIYDKKGINPIVIDVRNVSTITDYIIIAEGNVDRHVVAMAKSIDESVLKAVKEHPAYSEGLQNGDWVVLDYIEVMVHLFIPTFRERYQLEMLYAQGKIMDVPIQESSTVAQIRAD